MRRALAGREVAQGEAGELVAVPAMVAEGEDEDYQPAGRIRRGICHCLSRWPWLAGLPCNHALFDGSPQI